MWDGPYGEWGSRKHLLSSLDQSLRRLGMDYVDIFYHHRPDPHTPLEETMAALAHTVRTGKALYVALSNYPAELTARAAQILRDLGTPCLLHQPKYHLFERTPERTGLLDTLVREGIGGIAFCPLAQGLLTNRYLAGIPADSRATLGGFLQPTAITDQKINKIRALNDLAKARGQSLAQMALAWVLRHKVVTSVLIGASRPAQIKENLAALNAPPFTQEELQKIESILAS